MKLLVTLFVTLFSAVYIVVVHAALIVFAGFWWDSSILPAPQGLDGNLFRATLLIGLFGVFAVDGYRKYFLKGRRAYFFMSCISPLAFACVGFVYGLSKIYL